ncbi:MAG: isoprenylcysteine carboxylmethyltransferase family protein [Gemmatimonadota bacterium]
MAILAPLYGLVAYSVFFVTFLYAIGFANNVLVPKSMDIGVPASAAGEAFFVSLLVNVVLLTIFALQHSVMARPAFKKWWTQFVPRSVERSTYVLLASLALVLLFAQWRPMPVVVWEVSGAAALVLQAIYWTGWLLVLSSTFLIDHFELFGLKQVFARVTGRAIAAPVFRTPLFYKHVRHPIYLGFILAFWATPRMTGGHLLFAAATTGYILVGIWLEERDLVALFGDRYREYRTRVRMLLPLPMTPRSPMPEDTRVPNGD